MYFSILYCELCYRSCLMSFNFAYLCLISDFREHKISQISLTHSLSLLITSSSAFASNRSYLQHLFVSSSCVYLSISLVLLLLSLSLVCCSCCCACNLPSRTLLAQRYDELLISNLIPCGHSGRILSALYTHTHTYVFICVCVFA